MTWAKIIAGLLSLFRTIARWIEEARIRADERARIELEARREADDLESRVDHGLDQLQRDRAAIEADPRNRNRRSGNPVRNNPKEVP